MWAWVKETIDLLRREVKDLGATANENAQEIRESLKREIAVIVPPSDIIISNLVYALGGFIAELLGEQHLSLTPNIDDYNVQILP